MYYFSADSVKFAINLSVTILPFFIVSNFSLLNKFIYRVKQKSLDTKNMLIELY